MVRAGERPRRSGRWRRLVCAAVAVYLVVRAPRYLDTDAPSFDGLGLLAPFGRSFGAAALTLLWGGAVGAALLSALDRWVRVATPLAAVAGVIVLTHRSSQGQILWFDVLMALHLLVVGAAVLADGDDERTAGWALRLGALVTVATYVVAGVAKLRIGGLDWLSDAALERHIAFTATRADLLGGRASPLAEPLIDLGLVAGPAAVAVVVLELGAPLALIGRRWAVLWSIGAWLMHATIAATMFVVFHWPLVGLAFLPVIATAGVSRPERSSDKLAATKERT